MERPVVVDASVAEVTLEGVEVEIGLIVVVLRGTDERG